MNDGTKAIGRETWQWVFVILCLAFVSLLVRLKVRGLDVSMLAFVGVPTVLAVVVALSGPATSLEGRYLKHTTLGLLLVGILAADKFAFLLIVAPFAWLLAYLVAGQQSRQRPDSVAQPGVPPVPALKPGMEGERIRRKKLSLVAVCVSFAIISLGGRIVYARNLETTSVMFIGIPTALAILLALKVRPKSAMATAMTGITFVLLLSAILFGEGVVCILMAAPIFYVVGAIIASIMDSSRRKRESVKLMLATPLLLMSLEGSRKEISLPREQSVTVQSIVAANSQQVETALAAPLQFRTNLPLYLKMGFPRPVSALGSGLKMGDRRVIHFAGGEGKPGDLVMEITGVSPERVAFRTVSDHSKVAHWLHWEDAVVSWHPVDERHTEVSWSLRYRRGLDPAWYFGPWERYGVGLAANYLIENVATPAKTP